MIDDRYSVCFDSSAINVDDWNSFVEENDRSNIFQTSAFCNSFRNYPNYKPTPVFVLDKDNKICGIITLIIYSEKTGLIGKLSTRAISFDYPLVPPNIDTSRLTEAIRYNYQGKLIHWNLVPFEESEDSKTELLNSGFSLEPHLNFVFDLSLGENALFSNISKTRRKQIRRAENRNVKIRILNELSEFDNHYEILADTYRNAKIPLFNLGFFSNLIKGLNSSQLLVVEATVDDKMIGFRLVLLHNKYMFDFFAGSDKNYYSSYPNDILVWETLKYGANNGYTVFNFGGAGHPDKEYGVREFKKSFGGKLINSGVYKLPINKALYSIIKLAKKLRK